MNTDTNEPKHEGYLIPTRGLYYAGAALTGLVILVMFAMYGLYRGLIPNNEPEITVETDLDSDVRPPLKGAPLDPNQPAELTEYQQEQQKLLSSYGWADEEKKQARIPVERAISILAERGLPVRKSEKSKEERE